MKSKFKNSDCEYWKLRKKTLISQIAQLFVFVVTPVILFFINEELLFGVALFMAVVFFMLMHFQRHYESMKEGENYE